MPPMDDEIPLNDEPLVGDVVDTDDGGAEVILPPDTTPTSTGFGDNLVSLFSEQELRDMAAGMLEAIKRDKDARKRRDEQYEDGLRRTGLGDDAPGGAQFQGASRVVHPMLAEACVDFEARAIRELYPPAGPVRTSIPGTATAERIETAELKRDILNLQLTRLIPGYREEKESMLSQLPMGGSQYIKIWHDGVQKRAEFVPIDDFWIPISASNVYTALRATHRQQINEMEFEARIESGLYVDVESKGTPDFPDQSAAAVANAKIEGRDESDAYNEDGLRTVYETYTWKRLGKDDISGGKNAPYILHIDDHTEKVLGVYRNWDESDAKLKKLDWIVEYGFIPWRGAYKIGLPHLIGGLSGAATGALRALLDSAHAANAPTLLKLKSGRMVGQSKEVEVTQVQEIEGPAGIDDIRKLVSPIPFMGPSPILFQLLGFLVAAGKGVVTTAEEKISDVSDRMPVGTSLAMIEQGSKVFASIHQRLHASQAKELEILCRLNAKYPEEEWSELLGKPVDPTIFSRTDDIVPVSDPNIFSEAQRFAQMQAVMQMQGADAADPTVPWNKVEVRHRMLKLLNVPQPETLLPAPVKPSETDAVQENMIAVSGKPIKAFPNQDHLAHIEVHLRFILNPALGAGPAYGGQQLMPILGHCAEHLTMYYPQMVAQGQAMAAAQGKLDAMTSPDAAQAVASHMADSTVQSMQTIMQMWGAAQQLVQKKMPQPPMDPQVQVTMQVAQMEDAREKVKIQGQQQLDQMKAQGQQQKDMAELQMKAADQQHRQMMDKMKLDLEGKLGAMEQMMQTRIGELQQQVEIQKNEADNRQHQITELLKNHGDNQTQLMIAQIKEAMNGYAQANQPAEGEGGAAVDFNGPLQEMTRMLSEIEKAKTNDALTTVMEGLRGVITTMSAPKRVVRDKTGKAIGVEVVQNVDQQV
jgi:hypothetical protein